MATLVPLGLSALVLAGFLFVESRSKAPLMPLEFLHRGVFLAANAIGLIVAAASGSLGFIITIYMQEVFGYAALPRDSRFFIPPSFSWLSAAGVNLGS